ncbi:MAG: cysteine hydrolase [Oscillibacter sp.]|nr:cysteine hydrolase [Oscillibacter sp.]
MSEKGFAEHFVEDGSQLVIQNPAILVVDMVNDFCEEGGSMILEGSKEVYGTIAGLIAEGRKCKCPIIYLNDCHRPGKYDQEFDKRLPHCIDGTWGAEVVAPLAPREEDYCIKKRRFSGFFQTDLDLVLRELGVKTVIVTGVVTNICVRSTCHDAFFLGYHVVVPEDCVRATGPREQESTLWDIRTHFGSVTTSGSIIARFRSQT